jgi:hypothetical protein
MFARIDVGFPDTLVYWKGRPRSGSIFTRINPDLSFACGRAVAATWGKSEVFPAI